MRCHICDRALTETEVQLAPDNTFEPCSVCMEVIMDTAYSDGFTRPDDEEFDLDEDDELEAEAGEIETLDPETYRSYYDCCDVSGTGADEGFYD